MLNQFNMYSVFFILFCLFQPDAPSVKKGGPHRYVILFFQIIVVVMHTKHYLHCCCYVYQTLFCGNVNTECVINTSPAC